MNIKHHIALLAACAMAFGVISCKTESDDVREKNAPGKLTNVEFFPLNGGGYFKYTIPSDADFLYARAEYTIDTGETISKSSSLYCDSLVIEGFGQVKPYEVKLFAVDNFDNNSAPVTMTVTPEAPMIDTIIETVSAFAGFGTIVVGLENPTQEVLDVYIDITTEDGRHATRVFTTQAKTEQLQITDLEPISYATKVWIVDRYDNTSKTIDMGNLVVLSDKEIAKLVEKSGDQITWAGWTWLRNELLYGKYWNKNLKSPHSSYIDPDGGDVDPAYPEIKKMFKRDSMCNAASTRFEGRAHKFIDGIIDTGEVEKQGLNSYFHSGWGYPFSYFYDTNDTIEISRIRIWQRGDQLWAKYTVRGFEIWVSNDQTPEDGILDDWTFVGKYRINKPSSELEAAQEAIEGSEFWVYPTAPAFSRPFRYFRFKAIEDFNKGSIGCMAEITFFGRSAGGHVVEEVVE